MGNGTKFKLSNVLPNVFSKFKGIGKNRKLKGSSPSHSDFSDTDPNEFSMVSRDSHGDPCPSPMRTFPQNRDRRDLLPSSPMSQKTVYDIRFPIESPLRSRGSKASKPLSPSLKDSALSDPGCCSYDSTMALVPHDGRVRRAAPQAFGRCLIMSKCNSFNGSTHSDSEISDTDTSRAHGRRHARAMSVQLDGSPWEREREIYSGTTADESASQGSDTASARQRRRERRELNIKIAEQVQLYAAGHASPVHTVRCVQGNTTPGASYSADRARESGCHRSACPDSSREETDVDQNGTRLSRKLSFTTDDNARPFDEAYTSVSSDDDFYKVRSDHNAIGGQHRQQQRRPKSNLYARNDETDHGYSSSEVVLTEDERSHAAVLRREAVLAKTVRNASDVWARAQSRFSEEEKQTRGRRERLTKGEDSDVFLTEDEASRQAALYRREATLVKTVLSAKDWARENLRAIAKSNEIDRETLARLRAAASQGHTLLRDEESVKLVEYETFGLPPNSKEFHSRRSSRNPSPIGEVEKHTKGRVDYKHSSPHDRSDNEIKLHETHGVVVYEEFSQPLADYARDLYKSVHTDKKNETDFPRAWDTEFPSFRSDSALLGKGMGGGMPERGSLLDFSESESKNIARKTFPKVRGKTSSRSPSPRQEMISSGMKNYKQSSQSPSPRMFQKPSRSPSPVQEFTGGKKLSSRSPSPILEMGGKKSSPAPSPLTDFQVKKSSRTPSPKTLNARAEAGMQRLDSVAVVKASYDPYHDFRESMVEMILENDIQTAEDLEDLLQCYLSLNSSEYHKIIVQVFSDIWGDIFDQ